MWKEFTQGYSISNEGKVRNDKTKHILTFHLNSKGYYKICIKGKHYLIHRLVGIHFIPNLLNKPQINHKDMNKLNNHYSNLEWMTNIENSIHAYAHNNRSKFNKEDIVDILSSPLSRLELSKKYNVPKITIHAIKQGKNMKRFN